MSAGNPFTRIAQLELALDLAMAHLGAREPGDSRAVSDEFVALAAVHAGVGWDQGALNSSLGIIQACIDRGVTQAPEPKVLVVYDADQKTRNEVLRLFITDFFEAVNPDDFMIYLSRLISVLKVFEGSSRP